MFCFDNVAIIFEKRVCVCLCRIAISRCGQTSTNWMNDPMESGFTVLYRPFLNDFGVSSFLFFFVIDSSLHFTLYCNEQRIKLNLRKSDTIGRKVHLIRESIYANIVAIGDGFIQFQKVWNFWFANGKSIRSLALHAQLSHLNVRTNSIQLKCTTVETMSIQSKLLPISAAPNANASAYTQNEKIMRNKTIRNRNLL